MSIYGESPNQFRTRPSAMTLASFALFATLIGTAIGPFFFSLIRSLATQSLRPDYILNLHAPIAANPSLGLYPLHADKIVIGAAIAAAVVGLLTVLFVAVYPASQKIANRLALYTVGTAILGAGVIGPVADLGILRSLSRWKELSELQSGGVIAVLVVIVLVAVVWFERRSISLLGNFFEVGSPLQRLGFWALRIPLPWGAFGLASYLAGWWGGAIAAAGVAAATLADDLVHYPSIRYESLERPKMHEGLAASILVASALTASSCWIFGVPAAGVQPRAVVYEKGRLSIEPVSDLTNRIQEETMPRIEMNWSKEK